MRFLLHSLSSPLAAAASNSFSRESVSGEPMPPLPVHDTSGDGEQCPARAPPLDDPEWTPMYPAASTSGHIAEAEMGGGRTTDDEAGAAPVSGSAEDNIAADQSIDRSVDDS